MTSRPGIGVLRAADNLRHAKERTTLGSRAGEGVIVLGYTAEGHRQGAEPYRRFCTSTYRSGRLLREH